MRKINILLVLMIAVSFTACSNDDDGPTLLDVESKTVTNLHAPQTGGQGQGSISGAFTKFDFETGEATTSDTDWDIAFRGTTIIVNGGESSGLTDEPTKNSNAAAYIASGTMQSVASVDVAQLKQDSANGLAIATGSGNGWYTYDPTTNSIAATAGKILVFRTSDNRYAKVEITSYYKDNDPSSFANARYYTFNYVYNPNKDVTDF